MTSPQIPSGRDAAVHRAAAAAAPWNSHDTRLMIVAVIGIAIIVVLISWAKLHPFLALIIGSLFVGIAGGVPLGMVVTNFETGVGGTLQEVGLLIALGAMLGKLLADSGGADRIVSTLLDNTPRRLVPWTMALVAMIIGLPMFFEIGLVLLLPVIVLVAKKSGLKLMRVAIPALAGLSVLHGLIPPHPGPLIAIQALNANLGVTLAFGLVIAIPTVILCGPLFSILAARWVPVDAPALAGGVDTTKAAAAEDVRKPPSFLTTLGTILFPVVLMLAKGIADAISPSKTDNPPLKVFVDFVGEPLIAMVLAVLLASFTFGFRVGFTSAAITGRVGAAVGPIAAVMLIVGAGGGFKGTLTGAGVAASVAKAATGSNISVLVLGFLIAVAIRVATGSATVATTTAAGIVAPVAVAAHLTPTHLALLALAVGAGSLFLSHVNDAGFWLVKEMFGLTVGQTFKTWSVMETLVSLVSFTFVMIASAFF